MVYFPCCFVSSAMLEVTKGIEILQRRRDQQCRRAIIYLKAQYQNGDSDLFK